MSLRVAYLALAVAGTVIPYYFFADHFEAHGFGLLAFLGAVFANGAASGFAADLVVSSLVFWISMFALRRRADGPAPWGFMIVNLCIGLSAALPLYLYVRERGRDGR